MTSPMAGFHPSNALTYVSLLAGVAALGMASQGSPAAAGALVALSVIADTYDGAFARLFERNAMQRAFGAQLDSLSDAAAFGIVPVACATTALSSPLGGVSVAWWVAACLYGVCAITRLAFYNLSHEQQPGFVGMPAPIAALIWSSALLLRPDDRLSIAVLIVTAIAMVIPLRFPRPTGWSLAAFALWPIGIAAAHVTTLL